MATNKLSNLCFEKCFWMSSGSPCDWQSSKGVPMTTLGFKGCSNPKNSAQSSFHLLLIEIPSSAFSADIRSWERGTDEKTETPWGRKAQQQRAIQKCSYEHGTASVQQLQQDWTQRTTPISRLQKQKRRNLRESSQKISPRWSLSLLPEQKKQHFESSKHVEDYEYQRQTERDRERQRETERENKSLPRRERFISSSYDHHRETPHTSLFPSRRSSLVLFPSVRHLSFSRKTHTHRKHS